jgi:hypothetical protein
MKYAIEMGSSAIPSSISTGSGIERLLGGGTYRDTQSGMCYREDCFCSFKIREVGQNMKADTQVAHCVKADENYKSIQFKASFLKSDK